MFNISEVQTGIVPTGFLKFGNKGGVGVSMMLNDTQVCFVNSHLAAGNGELSRRNQDFRDISQMKLGEKSIYEHDVVIWLGDLNYRLTTSMSYEEVVRQCNGTNFASLFYFDQLKEQQRQKTAFNAYHELVPSFRPTYKFDVGTSNWDTSEKKRIPAWCDRVLYWVKDKSIKLNQQSYSSKESVMFSDHKPVCATFDLEVKKVDRKRRNAVYDELLKETDKRTNDLLPSISVSATDIVFGQVYFRQPAVRVLTIKNDGLTATRFAFANKHQSADLPENWLTLTPKSSFIDVGDTVEVTLQVVVDNEEAWRINERTELSCILVIRLDKGRDYFLVVTAVYEPSCFGSSLESLVEGKKSSDWLIDFDDTETASPAAQKVPPSVFYLVKTLREAGLEKVSFDAPFSDDLFFQIRDVLDAKQFSQLASLCRQSPATLFSTLQVLLRSFRAPLLPAGVPLVSSPAAEVETYLAYVRSLNSPNKEVFNFLVVFLRELNQHNPLDPGQFEILVGSLLRNVSSSRVPQALRFIRWCITGKTQPSQPIPNQ